MLAIRPAEERDLDSITENYNEAILTTTRMRIVFST